MYKLTWFYSLNNCHDQRGPIYTVTDTTCRSWAKNRQCIRKSRHSREMRRRQNRPQLSSSQVEITRRTMKRSEGGEALRRVHKESNGLTYSLAHYLYPRVIRVPHWYYFINFLPVASLVGIVVPSVDRLLLLLLHLLVPPSCCCFFTTKL